MKTAKTLLAVALLNVSAATLAETTTAAAPVYPVYPYGIAPVTIDAEQVKAAVEQYNRQARAALEQAQRAYVAAVEQQRKAAEDFQRFQAEQLKAATPSQKVSMEDLQRRSDELRADTARISDAVRERVLSGDRASMKEYFAARAQEMRNRFSEVDKEFEASRKAIDEHFAESLKSPLTPVVMPAMPGLPQPL
jgi:DNA anti-recombination protein RmuC